MESKMTYDEEQAARRKQDGATAAAREALLLQVFKLLGFKAGPRLSDEHPLGFFDASCYVDGTKGDRSIRAHAGGYHHRDRVEFRVSYPKPKAGEMSTYKLEYPSITCALSKTAEQIAADVKRRLLPAYEVELAKVRAQNAETEQYHANRGRNLRAVLQGRELDQEEQRNGKASLRGLPLPEHMYGYAQAGGDDISGLELHSVPVDLAAAIVKLCQDWKP